MGLQHAGLFASAVASVAAICVVVAMGLVAFAVVRRARRDDEPLFPELERARATAPDPAAFTELLTAGGTVADDVTRVREVASASGFEQAYALLALVDGESGGDPDGDGRDVPAPVSTTDPYASLATIADAEDDEPALAAFVDGTAGGGTATTESLDTLLPRSRARERRLRPRTA